MHSWNAAGSWPGLCSGLGRSALSLLVPTSPLVAVCFPDHGVGNWPETKFNLCCSPRTSLIKQESMFTQFIIYNWCLVLLETRWPNKNMCIVLYSMTYCLELFVQTTSLFCSHILKKKKKRHNMKLCLFLKYKFLSVPDRSHHYERSKIGGSLLNLIIWHFPTTACLLVTCRISFCSNIFCVYVSLILITVAHGNAYLLLILKM